MALTFFRFFGFALAVFVGIALGATMTFASPLVQDSDVEAVGKMMGLENKPLFGCKAETEGQIACQQNKKCICKWWPEDKMRMRPAGFRWDCGIKRPKCDMPRRNQNATQQPMPPIMLTPQIIPKRKKKKKNN
jgi:hypothetical protein